MSFLKVLGSSGGTDSDIGLDPGCSAIESVRPIPSGSTRALSLQSSIPSVWASTQKVPLGATTPQLALSAAVLLESRRSLCAVFRLPARSVSFSAKPSTIFDSNHHFQGLGETVACSPPLCFLLCHLPFVPESLRRPLCTVANAMAAIDFFVGNFLIVCL